VEQETRKKHNRINLKDKTENKFFVNKLVQLECVMYARGRDYEGRPPPPWSAQGCYQLQRKEFPLS
jgi:hypothetical protein